MEASAKVFINMYKLNIAMVTIGEDVKSFAYKHLGIVPLA
jgi:hypothetical protein